MTKQQLWTAILDAIGGVLAIWVGTLVPEQTAQMILATWAALQPVLIGILALISYDNKARLEAESRNLEIRAMLLGTDLPDTTIGGEDELKAMLTEAYESK